MYITKFVTKIVQVFDSFSYVCEIFTISDSSGFSQEHKIANICIDANFLFPFFVIFYLFGPLC